MGLNFPDYELRVAYVDVFSQWIEDQSYSFEYLKILKCHEFHKISKHFLSFFLETKSFALISMTAQNLYSCRMKTSVSNIR